VADMRVSFLNLSTPEGATKDWDRQSWVAPHLDDVVSRVKKVSGKKFRSRLVELSARLILAERGEALAGVVAERVEASGRAIEDIHLGSLVVDDIQDGSIVRRGGLALHRQVGVPLALNAGNWLYFSALKSLMGIHWSSNCECLAVQLAVEAMLLAHEGQAVDLGVEITKVEDSSVAEAVRASADRKTGALVAAAFGLGFLAAQPEGNFDEDLYRGFQEFGKCWGVSLQMFDDLGALKQSLMGKGPKEKLFEDLRNRRPSFFWTVVAENLPRSKFPEERASIDRFVKSLKSETVARPISGLEMEMELELEFETIQKQESFLAFQELLMRHRLFDRGMQIATERTELAVEALIGLLTQKFGCDQDLQMRFDSELQAILKISDDLTRAYLGD
jgi:geranylgeranyl pyrophosphate synthase